MARRRTTGKGMGPRGKLGSKQSQKTRARFKARVAAGKSGLTGGKKGTGPAGKKGSTISNYRAAQRQQVTNAALGRQATFQTGTPSGSNLPAGSFGISEAGRAQAERQKSVQGRFMPSNPAYKGVGARETRPTGFANTRLPFAGGVFNPLNAFTPEGRMTMLSGYADAAVDAVNFGKNVLTAGYAKDKFNVPKLPKFNDAGMQALRNVSSVALPLGQGRANLGRFRSVDPISGKAGFANEIAKMRLPNQGKYAFSNAPGAFRPKLTAKGIEGVNISTIAQSIFNPMSLMTGPTAGGTIALNTAMTGATLGDKAKSGGLNIGNAAQASEGGVDSGGGTARTLTNRALGAIDAVAGTDFDGLGGRTTPFGRRLTESVGAFGTLNQNMSDLSGQSTGPINTAKNLAKSLAIGGKNLSMEDMAASTSFAKAFKDKPLDAVANLNPDGSKRVIKTLKTLDKNKDVSEALANYGGEGFQTGLRDTASLVADNYDKLSTDPKANRKVVSNMLMGNDPRSEFAKRLAFQQKENPQLSMQSKIKYASDPNFKQFTGKGFENKIKGINKKEMGIIGSLGNFVLSNQGRDVVTGNVPGTNNALDLASNIINTGRDPSSSTYNASQGFLRTIGAGGQPTPGSIIRGINPFTRGGSGTPSRSMGGSTATPVGQLPQVPNPAQVELPIIPQQQQQGTQAKTLAGIQNQSYQNTFNNLMAQFRPRNINRRRTFRTAFNRDYFSQFV